MTQANEMLASKIERIAHMMDGLLPQLPFIKVDVKDLRQAVCALRAAAASGEPVANERDDGIDFALPVLCKALKVDPKSVNWDAATETEDGDVASVISNILEATAPSAPASVREALIKSGCTSPDGTFVYASTNQVIAALSAPEASALTDEKGK